MATNTVPYINSLRPKITIKTIDGADTLYTYNAFDSSHDISIASCEMENAIGETGTFNITVNDHNNEIGKDSIHNVKVFLELGKTSTSFQPFMIGYGDIFDIDRPQTNAQFYNISGFGSKIWAYQLFINRRETYRLSESDARIYNIVDNALTKRKWRPLKESDRSIEDITGFSNAGISTKVNTPLTVVNNSFKYFGDYMDELCDITGAVWFIDYSQGTEILTLSYNADLSTPILLKSGDLEDRPNDDPDTISYIKGAFTIGDNTTTEGGTATRLFTTTVSDNVEIFKIENPNTGGVTALNLKAVGQQVVIDNDARRIEQIVLSLSKQGEPESPNSRVNGVIVLDNGSNKPGTNVLDEFHVDLGSIKHNPEKITIDVDISAKELDVAQAKIWVILRQRSGITGDPIDDLNNVVYWHHNNVFNVNQVYYSGTASDTVKGSDVDTLSWNTVNTGPLYAIRVNSNIRRLFARTNKAAANKIRLREQFISTDFLSNPNDVTRYLSLNLSQISKGRRGVNVLATVPNNFLFRPYQWVGFTDGLSQISDSFQVQRATYRIGTGGGDYQTGTMHAELTLSGLYNSLIGDCNCI